MRIMYTHTHTHKNKITYSSGLVSAIKNSAGLFMLKTIAERGLLFIVAGVPQYKYSKYLTI